MLSEKEIAHDWKTNERWKGIARPYSPKDVVRLRGSVDIKHTLAERGAEKLAALFKKEPYVPALGALTGHQAVQMVQAGLKAIYVSGWQVAGDNNEAGQTYPDQSIYPSDSVPRLVERINNAFQREDEKQTMKGSSAIDWFAPIVADAEAGFGGPLNAFELMKWMIKAGAAAVHFEDQLSSAKKCGHLGGKVVVPQSEFIRKLISARFAADVAGVPTLLVARTDAYSAKIIANDVDPEDAPFIQKERTPEGFRAYEGGLKAVIARGLAYAPYADLVWWETSTPNIEEAREFATAIHKKIPGKWLAYNCSPSFNWEGSLGLDAIAKFQIQLGEMGYKFQFITLAGFHVLNLSMFDLAHAYAQAGMAAYTKHVQRPEFEAEKRHYQALKHQAFVGTEYFDEVNRVISEGRSSTGAMFGSTEAEQF